MSVACDRFGFFNGIYGLEQSNWANYWRGIIPDGILSGFTNEMEVYAQSDGMKVHVRTGQAMIDNHRAWITTEKEVEIAASSSNPRKDLIVLRVVYGNNGESTVVVDSITGTPAASPSAPSCTTITGGVYEIPLAEVTVAKGAVTITAESVTDRRYIYKLPSDGVNGFSANNVLAKNDVIHRNNSALASLTIYLPKNPHATFISEVDFTSNASFTGITFRQGTSSSSSAVTVKTIGDGLKMPSKRYSIIIWWDGKYYWAAGKAVSL